MTTSYRLDNLTKHFPGVLAVDSVSFEVRRGEVHGIIGKNGAGKSVTMGMIAGTIPATSGQLYIGEDPVNMQRYDPVHAQELGVALIPQEPQFAFNLSVSDNLFMGRSMTHALDFVNQGAMYDRVREIAQKMSVRATPRQVIGDLPLEDQQMLAFGKALFIQEAHVILLDEITASLTKERTDLLRQFLMDALEDNKKLSFTLITHHINEVIEFCDRVTVMRDGQFVQTLNVSETNEQELAALVVGEETGTRPYEREDSAKVGDTLLNVRGLTKEHVFSEVNFAVRAGEVVGLAGLDGSGKNEVMEVLVGLSTFDRGTIEMNGQSVRPASPRHAFQAGLAYLPKKREERAVIHNRSVSENTLITVYERIGRWLGFINHARGGQVVRERIAALSVKTPGPNTNIDHLSGGNRQKVMMNRIMLTQPKIYVLNEPTRGVDLSVKPEILNLVRNQLTQNSGVVFTSESEEELVQTCDRILILYRGKVLRTLNRTDPTFNEGEVYRTIQGIWEAGAAPAES